MPGIALLIASRGEHIRAAELYGLVWGYPMITNSRTFRVMFGEPLAGIAALLPADAAKARARPGARAVTEFMPGAARPWNTDEELQLTSALHDGSVCPGAPNQPEHRAFVAGQLAAQLVATYR